MRAPSIIARLRERKLFAWTAAYVTGAWVVFQIVESLGGRWGWPEQLLRAIDVLLVVGFLLTVVLAWFHGEKGRQKVSLAEGLLLAAILVGGAASFRVIGMGGVEADYTVEEPRRSYLVQAHRIASTSSDEEVLAVDAAAALTSFLGGWSEVRASPLVSRAGLSFNLGLSGSVRSSLEESLRLAREAGVGTLATVVAEIAGPDADVHVTLFDVSSGEQIADPFRNRGGRDDPQGLVLPIAKEMLELSGAPNSVLLERESADIGALRQVFDGLRHLDAWELEAAEASFREAIEADSTLARAHHGLGVTRYWQTARDRYRTDRLEPEMVRQALAAVRHSDRLPYRDSLHAAAFLSLALGAHDEARARYRALTRTDSTDAHAWLFVGAVEYTDPVTVARADGALSPRSNLNEAARAFRRAVELAPDMHLGYGYLFEIYRSIADETHGCPPFDGFRRPEDAEIVELERVAVERLVFFCAAALDSLEWLSEARVEELGRAALAPGAARFQTRSVAEVERWARFAPESPRPWEELSTWHTERRRRVAASGRGPLADSLAARALAAMRRALRVSSDTTPERLVRLGSLTLAAGDVEGALALTEEGVARLTERDGPGAPLPAEALNPYVAAGLSERALALTARAFGDRVTYQSDSITGRDIPWVADLHVVRAGLLGSLGLADRIGAEFEAIERAWDAAGYGEAERRLLRAGIADAVEPALVLDDGWRARWLGSVEDLSPRWRAFLAPPGEREPLLDRSLEAYRGGTPDPVDAWVLAVLFQRSGRHERAIELFREASRFPLDPRRRPAAWGIRTLAVLGEARSLEALGDPRADAAYERVSAAWEHGDIELDSRTREVRTAAAGPF